MALLSHIPYHWQSTNHEARLRKEWPLMLDNPEKTARLMAALKAAVPFEVNLTPEVIKQLQAKNVASPDQTHRTVSDLSYAGDEGGIVCHIQPEDAESVVVVSLTHVRVRRKLAFAAAVLDYQKHRVKKLKKQGGT